MTTVLAAIPYTTFPTIELGPLSLRTFGLMVALGVLLGAWLAARYGEEPRHPPRHHLQPGHADGAGWRHRLPHHLGALAHSSELDSPFDAFAIWQGGLQFSGGFVFAVHRRLSRVPALEPAHPVAQPRRLRLRARPSASPSVAIGCYSVGEHFGSRHRPSSSACATRAGRVREGTLGTDAAPRGPGVPPDRALRAALPARALRRAHVPAAPAPPAATMPGTAMADLLRVLRRGSLRSPTPCA